MKKSVLFVLAVLAHHLSVAAGIPIQPVGEKVGEDGASNCVYQISANGIKIGYKLIGAGQPLVMIVGLGNTTDRWPQEVVDALSKQYQLIILDNRGMGYSTANDATFTYKLFADDVIALLDALQVGKAHVLGFSMGSTIAQELLLEYPQRVSKAVIYATSTDGSRVADVLKGKAPPANSPTMQIVWRQIEATTHWKTPLDRMAKVANQVMFLVGTADEVVGVESSKNLAATVPGAWLAQFKNGEHGLMAQTPAAFAKTVLAFLDIDESIPPSGR